MSSFPGSPRLDQGRDRRHRPVQPAREHHRVPVQPGHDDPLADRSRRRWAAQDRFTERGAATGWGAERDDQPRGRDRRDRPARDGRRARHDARHLSHSCQRWRCSSTRRARSSSRTRSLAAVGTIELVAPEAPLTLFIWGIKRIVPVRLSSFSIAEEAYDVNLNPIRAKVTLGMQVLSYSDLSLTNPGYYAVPRPSGRQGGDGDDQQRPGRRRRRVGLGSGSFSIGVERCSTRPAGTPPSQRPRPASPTAKGGIREVRYVRRRFVPQPDSHAPARGAHARAGRSARQRSPTSTSATPTQFWRVCDANTAMNPVDLTDEAEIGRSLVIPVPQA